jgi:hypothetical protein
VPGLVNDWVIHKITDANVIARLKREIVLLYKAKAPTAKGNADFATVLPHLRQEQRGWLVHALDITGGSHRWAEILARGA